jgi:hypothetical protein
MKYLILVTFLIGCGTFANAADMLQPPTTAADTAISQESNMVETTTQSLGETMNRVHATSNNEIRLLLQRNQNDYASCAGVYKKSPVTTIRGKPVYFSEGQQRVIFFKGSSWGISSYGYAVLVAKGATGAFYTAGDGSCLAEDCSCLLPRYVAIEE